MLEAVGTTHAVRPLPLTGAQRGRHPLVDTEDADGTDAKTISNGVRC
jgi:hypothetical protein